MVGPVGAHKRRRSPFNSCSLQVTSQPVKLKYKMTHDVGAGLRLAGVALTGSLKHPAASGNNPTLKSKLSLDKLSSWLEGDRGKKYSLLEPVMVDFEVDFELSSQYRPVRGFARCNLGRTVINLGPDHILLLMAIQQKLWRHLDDGSDAATSEQTSFDEDCTGNVESEGVLD